MDDTTNSGVLTPLCEIARRCGTDKGGDHIPYGDPNHICHKYTPVYHELFEAMRFQSIALLEIGVSEGKSMRMWREYFPAARLYGWDIDIERAVETAGLNGCTIQQVDQSNAASLLGAWAAAGRPFFDIIIDDGSHKFEDQVLTFKTMLPALKPTGIYVIEDHTHRIKEYVPPIYTWREYVWKDYRDYMQVIRREQ